MARGRMISKSLSTSRKFANAGSEFAQTLYMLIVSHADDFGRQSGDAFTVKHQVFPTSPRPEQEFESALVQLTDAGLITRYAVNGDLVLQVVGFEAHQVGLHKRSESRFPDNPGTSGNFPENPIRTELKGTEGNGSEANGTRIAAQSPGILSGSLPRDHMHHVWCGPQFRLCVSYKQMADLEKRWGGDGARQAVEAFLGALEAGLGPNDGVGGPVWLLQHFDAHMAATGRLKAAPTATERKAAAKRNDFEEAKRKLAEKYGEGA